MFKIHQTGHKKTDFFKNCQAKQALRNHQYYPNVEILSNHMDESPEYHWASLFRLVGKVFDGLGMGFIPRESWAVVDSCGRFTFLHFYKDYSEKEKPVTFSISDLRPGKTFAILYPQIIGNCGMMINFTNFDMCYLFDAHLENVYDEADRLLKVADCEQIKKPIECFGCSKTIEINELIKCPSCSLAKYCSKVILKDFFSIVTIWLIFYFNF